jgi:hypothetical protein
LKINKCPGCLKGPLKEVVAGTERKDGVQRGDVAPAGREVEKV